VLTIVGATPKVPTIPPTETGSALTFHDICACPNAMATIGSHERRMDPAGSELIGFQGSGSRSHSLTG
jgi:hypothetical protein